MIIELTLGQLIGLIIGEGILATLFGFFLAACCTAASDADAQRERMLDDLIRRHTQD